MKKYYFYAVVITLIAVGALVASTLVGSDRKADGLTIDDLRSIENAVDRYTRANDELPDSLDELDTDTLNNLISDYTYRQLEPDEDDEKRKSYELCAEFEVDTVSGDSATYYDDYSYDIHKKGKQCFDREVYAY